MEEAKAESRTTFLPYYDEATFTPKWLYPGTEAVQDLHQIPPFSLINQEGEVFTDAELEAKIYVADFFFTTCPGICPKMTANMSVLQEAFMDDPEIVLLSHSVTPELDSVEVLQRYAEEKGVISGKWQLLTGDRELIYDLGRNQYFVEEDLGLEKTADDFLHTENFVLVDKNRHIRGIYNGLNKTAVRQLITDIKTLKEEF
ncbi:MAG: SCO family protein [Bacteroidia bacterium]|nr:SCO family protein [Bacteroidia bacterium]